MTPFIFGRINGGTDIRTVDHPVDWEKRLMSHQQHDKYPIRESETTINEREHKLV